MQGPILICYDGSEDARAAIEAAAPFFQGRETVVVCFWQPFAAVAKRFAVNLLEIVQDAASVNEREGLYAERIAAEGAELAEQAGLVAEPRAVKADRAIDETMIGYADQIDTPLIVLGSRGRSNLRSMLLGDVAHDVVQRASRPIFLVPSSRLGGRRREELAEAEREEITTS